MTDEYIPPPGATLDNHDPQLAWLQRQLPPAPARSAGRPASVALAPLMQHEPPTADDAEWVEEDRAFDDDDAEEERTPTRRRRRRVATDTALIPRRWIIFVMFWTVRTLMLALLSASFVGSIASFNPAGIAPVLAAFPWLRFVAPWVVGVNRTAFPKRLFLRMQILYFNRFCVTNCHVGGAV